MLEHLYLLLILLHHKPLFLFPSLRRSSKHDLTLLNLFHHQSPLLPHIHDLSVHLLALGPLRLELQPQIVPLSDTRIVRLLQPLKRVEQRVVLVDLVNQLIFQQLLRVALLGMQDQGRGSAVLVRLLLAAEGG